MPGMMSEAARDDDDGDDHDDDDDDDDDHGGFGDGNDSDSGDSHDGRSGDDDECGDVESDDDMKVMFPMMMTVMSTTVGTMTKTFSGSLYFRFSLLWLTKSIMSSEEVLCTRSFCAM